jgi:flagellar biosynthesis/type III secretory pathway protein FliH
VCPRFPCRVYREGHEHGQADGYAKGHAAGYAEGYAKGHTGGYAKGYPDGIAACPRPHGGG